MTLAPASPAPVTVDWATADGTAKAGEDYLADAGTLTFAPGETEKTVAVAVLDDAHDEGEENRNRLWQTRRWAMRRKMLAITPTVAPIHRAPTATPRNPGIWRLRRTMSPIPLRRRRRVP